MSPGPVYPSPNRPKWVTRPTSPQPPPSSLDAMLRRGAGPHSQSSATRRLSAAHPGAYSSFSRTDASSYRASPDKAPILGLSEHPPPQPLHLHATEADRERLLPNANANDGTSSSVQVTTIPLGRESPEPSSHLPPLDESLEVSRPPTPPLPPPSDRPPTPPLPPNLASPPPTVSPRPPTPPLDPPPEAIPPVNCLHPPGRPVDNLNSTEVDGGTLTQAFSLEDYDAGRFVSATRAQRQPHHPVNPRKRKSSILNSPESHTSEINGSESKSAPSSWLSKQKAKRSRIRRSLPSQDHSVSERVPYPLPPRPLGYPENAAPGGRGGPNAPRTSSAGPGPVASGSGARKNKDKKNRPSSLPPGSVEGRSMGSISDRSPVTQTITTLPNGGPALLPTIPVHPPVPVGRRVPFDPRIPSNPRIPARPRISGDPPVLADPRIPVGSRVFSDSRTLVKPRTSFASRAPIDPDVSSGPRAPVNPRIGRPGSRPVSRHSTPVPVINGKPEAINLPHGPTSIHRSESKGTLAVPTRKPHGNQPAQQIALSHPDIIHVAANIQSASALQSLQGKPLSQSEAFLAARAEIEARKFSGDPHNRISSNLSGSTEGLHRNGGISAVGHKGQLDAQADDDNEPKHFRLPKNLLSLFKMNKGLTGNTSDSAASSDAQPPKTAMAATVEPATADAVAVDPATVEPVTAEPAIAEPATVEPVTVEPVTVDAVAVEPAPETQPIDDAPVAGPSRPNDLKPSPFPLRVDESREQHKVPLPLPAGAKSDAHPSPARKKPFTSVDGGRPPARPPKKRKEGSVTSRKRKQAPAPPKPSLVHAPPARTSELQMARKIKQVINISSGLFPPAVIEDIEGLSNQSIPLFDAVDFERQEEESDNREMPADSSPIDSENLFAIPRDRSPSVSSQATRILQPSLGQVGEPLFLSKSPTPYSDSPAQTVKKELDIKIDGPDPPVGVDSEAGPPSIGMRSAQVVENGVVTVSDQWPDESKAVIGPSGADEADELLMRYQLTVDRETTPASLDIVLSRSSTEERLTEASSSPEIPLASLRPKNIQASSWRDRSHDSLDRLSVVLPISKARRRRLIQRGIYST